MNYQDATTVLSDPFNLLTGRKRRELQKDRAFQVYSSACPLVRNPNGPVIRSRKFSEERQNKLEGDLVSSGRYPKSSRFKLAGKMQRATVFQLAKWNRRVARRLSVTLALCQVPGISPKVAAMLEAKRDGFAKVLMSVRQEAARRMS